MTSQILKVHRDVAITGSNIDAPRSELLTQMYLYITAAMDFVRTACSTVVSCLLVLVSWMLSKHREK